MTWIWLIQFSLDIALILTVMALWKPEGKRKKSTDEITPDQRLKAALNVLENRALALERDVQLHRRQMDETKAQRDEYARQMDELRARVEAQFARLADITAKAQEILERGEKRLTPYAPSLEELDFRRGPAAKPTEKAPQLPAENIPTLKELEEARVRHSSHLTLDLKTILRDQLA